MRALIDTCIIIDALQDRGNFSKPAKELLIKIADRQIDGFITANSITDIYYLMYKFLHDNTKCREAIRKLTEVLCILDTSSGDCLRALHSDIKDFEDALMIETASSNKMDFIVTRNIKDYQNSTIPVYLPEDIINLTK